MSTRPRSRLDRACQTRDAPAVAHPGRLPGKTGLGRRSGAAVESRTRTSPVRKDAPSHGQRRWRRPDHSKATPCGASLFSKEARFPDRFSLRGGRRSARYSHAWACALCSKQAPTPVGFTFRSGWPWNRTTACQRPRVFEARCAPCAGPSKWRRGAVSIRSALAPRRLPSAAGPCPVYPPSARLSRRARVHAGKNANHSTGAESRSISGRAAGSVLGRAGARSGNMPAASHSSPPLRVLHALQAVTMLVHTVFPP